MYKFINLIHVIFDYYCQQLLDYDSNILRIHEIDIVLECLFNFK